MLVLVGGGIGITPLLSIYGQIAADFHERERQKTRRGVGVGGGSGNYQHTCGGGTSVRVMDQISSISTSTTTSSTGGLKTVILIWAVRELALFELFAADVS